MKKGHYIENLSNSKTLSRTEQIHHVQDVVRRQGGNLRRQNHSNYSLGVRMTMMTLRNK